MKFLLDGSIVRYFSCNDNHGLYVRPGQIESVLNDLQPDLVRSSSNHSIKSQGSSTGSIPTPSTSSIPKTSGLPTKQSALRTPTPSTASKLPGIKLIKYRQKREKSIVLLYKLGFDDNTDQTGSKMARAVRFLSVVRK
jgi:dynactin complex subunit